MIGVACVDVGSTRGRCSWMAAAKSKGWCVMSEVEPKPVLPNAVYLASARGQVMKHFAFSDEKKTLCRRAFAGGVAKMQLARECVECRRQYDVLVEQSKAEVARWKEWSAQSDQPASAWTSDVRE